MGRLLLLSNGHGEDLSGALLGRALQAEGHNVEALPLVGKGQPYRDAGIDLIGGTQEFSTGGLGYTSLQGRLTELVQGQVIYLLRRLIRLLRIAKRYDLVVVIGDVIPVMAAWLSSAPRHATSITLPPYMFSAFSIKHGWLTKTRSTPSRWWWKYWMSTPVPHTSR